MLRSISYFIVVIMFLVSGLFAQQTCMLISEQLDPDPLDATIYAWLQLSYSVDIASGDEVDQGFYSVEDFQAYDFLFVSESISSEDTEILKGAPVPIFYTELWASKTTVTGWVPSHTSPLYYGNTTDNTVKIVDGSHVLAAGFATDAEVVISSQTDDTEGPYFLTYSNPQVDHIPIAVLTSDESRIAVMGIEKNTELHNNDGVKDGTIFSQNRCAAVGVNANSQPYLTDDAFLLIEAGINWILDTTTTAINEENIAGPLGFELEQNYPNPFNPSTNISFTLGENAHTVVTVYDLLGQKVATLVDNDLLAGSHTFKFDGSNLESGVYFYNIVAGNYKDTKKMMLVK